VVIKKIIALSAALLISFGLIACSCAKPNDPANTDDQQSLEQDAYSLWIAASTASNTAEEVSFMLDYQMTMSGAIGGMGLDISMRGPIQVANRSASDVQLTFDVQARMLGQSIPLKAWFKDGYYYYDMLGEKTKKQMTAEEVLEQNNATTLSFTESAIKSQSVYSAASGEKRLEFLLDGTEMVNLVENALANSGEDVSSLNIEMGDVALTVFLNESGTLTECTYTFTSTIDKEGREMDMDCTVTLTDMQYDNVTLVFPDDLDSYREA
jgi:hypothetical protein